MATLKTNLIEPEGATTTLTVGESGGDLVIGADSLKADTLKSRQGNPTVTSFTTVESTTWTAPTGVTSVEYLVVAGGGSGGGNTGGADGSGGGGGAGGYRTGTLVVSPGTAYTVTVGGGGVAGSPGDTLMQGDDSVLGSITSAGGGAGGGGAWPGPIYGVAGGSGGGGMGWYTTERLGGAGNTPATTPRQGFKGGTNFGISGPEYSQGGGGGGSSSVGRDGSTVSGTNTTFAPGGAGTSNNITGSYVTYASGGRGAGNGWSAGVAGGANTGDGGDGEGTSNGGSGVVVVKYTLPGGTPQTLFVSDGSGNVSSVDSGWGGVQVLLSSQTASNNASISFTSGIDSTYEEYIFEFININPATDQYLTINFSSDGGSNYNMTKTTTFFEAYHYESGASDLTYQTGWDLAQSTAGQPISQHTGAEADECMAGELHLYNPASTTYVKNFYSRANNYAGANIAQNSHVGGYVNSTTAINAIQFAMSSGNFDGTIKMYGIK
jgi:hypothetical protein